MTIVHMGRGVGADWCTVANDPKEAREQEGRWPVPCWFLDHLWCLVSLVTVVPQSVERECGGINQEMWLARGAISEKVVSAFPAVLVLHIRRLRGCNRTTTSFANNARMLHVINNYFASKVSKYQLYPIPDGGYGSRLQGKISIYI